MLEFMLLIYGHIMLHFMTISLSDGNSGPNYCLLSEFLFREFLFKELENTIILSRFHERSSHINLDLMLDFTIIHS